MSQNKASFPDSKYDVFVSYSVEDKPVADAVVASLESNRIKCWVAPRDVLPGLSWAAAIVDAINQSRLMLLIYSSRSNQSRQVTREVERAANRGIPILPFRIEDVPLSKDMEYFISSSHWLDALTPPLERHLRHLTETVSLILQRIGGPEEEEEAYTGPAPAAPLTPTSPQGRTRRRTRLAVAAGLAAVVVTAGVAGAIFINSSQDSSRQAIPASPTTTAPEPTAAATTKIITKFDASYGTANASGWKWGVAEITTGTQELTRDTEPHNYPWVFYVVRGSAEIGTADGERVIHSGEAAMVPAHQDHTHRYQPESEVLVFRPSDSPFGNFHYGNRLWESDAPAAVNAGQSYSIRIREYTLAPGVAKLTAKGQWGYIEEGTLTVRTSGAAAAQQAGTLFSLNNSDASQVLSNEGAAPVRFIVVGWY